MIFQEGDVTGQGCRVAGDVDQAAGGHAGDGFDGVGVQAFAGRVYYHHVRAEALVSSSRAALPAVGGEKSAFSMPFSLGVFPGIFHRLFHYLHADYLSGGPAMARVMVPTPQ